MGFIASSIVEDGWTAKLAIIASNDDFEDIRANWISFWKRFFPDPWRYAKISSDYCKTPDRIISRFTYLMFPFTSEASENIYFLSKNDYGSLQ